MFTTGTKLLAGSAALTSLLAAVYGIMQGGALGTIGLVFAAVGLTALASINGMLRDSNVSAMDHDGFDRVAANQATATPSLWPLLAGLGATGVTAGLVTNSVVFVLGVAVLLAAALEWMVQAWAERVSNDRRFNTGARHQLADPLELPIGGAILAGVVIFAFSRVMLGLPSKSATVVGFAVVATIVLILGVVVGVQRRISVPAMTGILTLGVVAIGVVGAVYGLNGSREIHAHETTADLAAEDHCAAEETHADEKASQTVSAKSNIAAELNYDGATLFADVPGFDGAFDQLTLPRGNPNNVLFRNNSGAPARVVIDMHPLDEEAQTPERICSAIVEDGGVQFLTVKFGPNSTAIEAALGEGYEFVVPGSDAELEVIVP